jgi:hypothetical protein
MVVRHLAVSFFYLRAKDIIMVTKKTTTCHVKGCHRNFEDGDKHLERGVWQVGYYNEGLWYCSLPHFRKAARREGLLQFIFTVFAVTATCSAISVVYFLFNGGFYEPAIYAAIGACAISFWVANKTVKLRQP